MDEQQPEVAFGRCGVCDYTAWTATWQLEGRPVTICLRCLVTAAALIVGPRPGLELRRG